MESKKITLFNNKSENPKAPIITGFISTDNKKIQKVSLWKKISESGLEYFYGEVLEIDIEKAD